MLTLLTNFLISSFLISIPALRHFSTCSILPMDYRRLLDRNGTLEQRSDSRVPRSIYRPIEYRRSFRFGISRILALFLPFHSDNIARDGSLIFAICFQWEPIELYLSRKYKYLYVRCEHFSLVGD